MDETAEYDITRDGETHKFAKGMCHIIFRKLYGWGWVFVPFAMNGRPSFDTGFHTPDEALGGFRDTALAAAE